MRPHLPILVLVVALAAPAEADHCIWIGSPDLATPTGHYLDQDLCQPTCMAHVDIWQESNGIDGLQTDEAVECYHGGEPDTLVLRVRQ